MNDERIMAWLDGELSSDEAAQLEAEIATNPTLQADVEQIRSVKVALQSLPRERAPRNFTLDANEYGRVPRERFSIFPRWATSVLALAGVVLVAAILFTQLPLGGGEQETMVGDSAEEIAKADEPIESIIEEVQVAGDMYVGTDSDDASDEIADIPALESTQEPIEAELLDEASSASSDADEDRGPAILVTQEVEFEQEIRSAPPPIWAYQVDDKTEVQSQVQSAADIYDTFSYENTFSGAMAEITGTDGTDGTGTGTVKGDGSWADALRDLVIGFLILLLVICILAFGLGMWILLGRHQY